MGRSPLCGFVATGPPGESGDTFISFSADGRTWEPIPAEDLPLPSFLGSPTTVTSGPTGFVVLVSFDCEVGAWFSANGRDWIETSDLPPGCIHAVVTSTSSGWHMVAATESAADAVVATSVDGTTWDVIDTATTPPSGLVGTGGALAVDGDTWVFLGHTPEPPGTTPVVWTSGDGGISWAERSIEIIADPVSGDYQPWTMVTTGTGFVGTGQVETLADEGGPNFVVSSPDGTTWRQEYTTGPVQGLVAADDILIASGAEGVYTWQQTPSDLAKTGTDSTTLLALAVSLLAGGIAALAVGRRLVSS